MKLTIGFSPCPNDTFIFDALVNKKIDTKGLDFEAKMEDVETLNQWAFKGKLDITKLSFPAFFQVLDSYVLLNSGSALGKGVGPLLIRNEKHNLTPGKISDTVIALPGQNTTANLLFSFSYPDPKKKIYLRFDQIEDYILEHDDCLGVIIHENRFTYQDRGLHKVVDLGDLWESKMNVPIPLGGIAAKRSLDPEIIQTVNDLIRQSLEFAFENYPEISDYVREHSQAMSEDVMRKHIDLYVNNYSLDLGEEGKKAIRTLNTIYTQQTKNAKRNADFFL